MKHKLSKKNIPGHGTTQQNMQKLVSCDMLKEKLEKLVKQSKSRKIPSDWEKDVKITLSGKVTKEEPINNGKLYSDKFTKPVTPAETMNRPRDVKPKPKQPPPHNDLKPNDIRNCNIKRSESWQGSSKHSKGKQIHPHHYETRTSEIRHLETFANGQTYEMKGKKTLPTPENEFAADLMSKRDSASQLDQKTMTENSKVPVYSEIDRKDPKRITKRYIQRKKFANEENGNQDYEKVDLLPPCQFRDAPPPPEAFRDPPEPIDNILYYVVESVNENREANRRREYEEAKANRRREYEDEKKIAAWKKEYGSEAEVYKLAEYVPK